MLRRRVLKHSTRCSCLFWARYHELQGKEKTWIKLLTRDTQVLDCFVNFGDSISFDEAVMAEVEKGVCKLYGCKSASNVNAARHTLFRSSALIGRQLPPTRDALRLHIMRAWYQVTIWKKALEPLDEAPDPTSFGRHKEGDGLIPVWMTDDNLSENLAALTRCSCKTGCTRSACSVCSQWSQLLQLVWLHWMWQR